MAICPLRSVLVTLALSWIPVLHAQAPVTKMDQVTEEGLVNQLDIKEPASEGAGTTRSVHPTPRRDMAAGPPGAGRSNLLMTFKTGSAELTPETTRALATVAKALKSDRLAGNSFSIEGHADPRGSVELNQKLSQARAESVVEHLVSNFGILRERLSPVGKGSSEPLNTDRPDAPENRRVTIVTQRR